MTIPSVENVPKEIKSTSSVTESGLWINLESGRLETNATGTVLRFRLRELGEWVELTETDVQVERKLGIYGYYEYPEAPFDARALIHDNDAAFGIPSIGGTAIHSKDIQVRYARVADEAVFLKDTMIGGATEVDWQIYSSAFRVVAGSEKLEFLPSGLKQRLEGFGELTEGWDSYGSEAISHAVVARSIVLLQDLYGYLKELGRILPEPFVAPVPDGRIQIEWSGVEKEVEVTVDEKGIIEYLLFSSDDVWSYRTGSVSTARGLGELLQTEVLEKRNEP